MITYDEFVRNVTDGLKNRYPERKIDVHRVLKPNLPVMDGVTVLKEGSSLSPMVYLNDLYDSMREGASFDLIMDNIDRDIDMSEGELEIDISRLKDPAFIRDKIVLRLINYEKNREMLNNMPHRKYLDLAVVYYFLINDIKIGKATSLVLDSHMKLWGITEDEMYACAMRNSPRVLGSELKNMEVMVRELMLKQSQDSALSFSEIEEFRRMPRQKQAYSNPMFVLTSADGTFGAACMLYTDHIKKLAEEFEDDIYILPSSVHEVILLPKRMAPKLDLLENIVRGINASDVDDEYLLSDSIYMYSLDKDAIVREISS